MLHGMYNRLYGSLFLFLFGTLGVAGAGCEATKNTEGETDSEILDVSSDPEIGADSFVSADGNIAGDSYSNDLSGDADDEDAANDGGDSGRSVEEGDIYRVGAARNIIFNLNSYRGLQVIDISDVEHPAIIGRLPITGYPVEMYVVDDTVYMLLNNWQGYWGTRGDIEITSYWGGIVVSASVADLTHPVELDRTLVPGYIMTSRLIGNDADKALYIAASNWNDNAETVVKSLYLSDDGTLEDKTELNLGGYVQDIQASPSAMMVARYDWSNAEGSCTVAVIDVSDPKGSMVEGAEIPVEGLVSSKTNMDLRGNILRIVSGSNWSDSTTNHLQTFDISDISRPVALDHDTFGEGEQLYATLFLENKAFFVTYFRTDPFHAFEIDDAGNATEKSEYIISGWNNFFKPVIDNTRIIGIGTNDDAGRRMAVSLYDITDLSNPNPFIARQEVDASDYSWSEASFDDRAFSVIENAVSIDAPDGTEETGLVLLPFSGYDSDFYKGVYAVQMFTFSANTLTRRGLLSHGTPVRRSFNPDDDLTANLSEQELSLFNTENPDDPQELGRVALAPQYDDLLVFGSKGVRVKRATDAYYSYYYRTEDETPKSGTFLETVPLSDPETVEPLAAVEVGAHADVVKVGNLAVAISQYWKQDAENPTTLIQVADFSDPLSPAVVSTLETDAIINTGGSYYLDYECGMSGYYSGVSSLPVNRAVVFPMYEWQKKKLGIQKECSGRYFDNDKCASGSDVCDWVEAYYYCYATDDEPETCTYSVYECVDTDGDGSSECTATEMTGLTRDQIPDDYPYMDEWCNEYDRYRYWDSQSFYILNLTTPETPVLSEKIAMPEDEESAGVLARGDAVYINYKIPYDVPDDSKEYVRYYFKKMDLSDPASPVISEGINVPGVVREINDDVIYTQDAVYRDDGIASAVNRLTLKDGRAVLDARRRFDNRYVTAFVADKEGRAFVVHSPTYYGDGGVEVAVDAAGGGTTETADASEPDPNVNLLTILDMDDEMSVLSETPVDTWSSLHMVKDDKALFSVPGGILLINLDDLEAPFAQAYFPINGWPFSVFMSDGTLFLPSGPYGIYTFDTDMYNLMEDK